MKRFQNIVVLLDLSHAFDTVLQRADQLQQQNQAQLHYLIVLDFKPSQAQQDKILSSLTVADAPAKIVFVDTKPVVAISRYCVDQQIDLILMQPDEKQSVKHFFFGSLALSLMRKAPCPVWVETAKQPTTTAYQRVMIAVDPCDEAHDKAALNDKLIQIGTSLAQREGAECHLVTAWYLPGEGTMRGVHMRMPNDEIQALRVQAKADHAQDFEALQYRNQSHLKGVTTHMINGRPDEAIIAAITDLAVDILVLGTVARSGIKGLVIGNTAESIISQVDCALIAVKPDGFQSPLL